MSFNSEAKRVTRLRSDGRANEELEKAVRCDFGELGEGRFEVFDDLKGDDAGIGRWSRVLTAASFTVGGTETLSVSRETGQLGFLIQGDWRCLRGLESPAAPSPALRRL